MLKSPSGYLVGLRPILARSSSQGEAWFSSERSGCCVPIAQDLLPLIHAFDGASYVRPNGNMRGCAIPCPHGQKTPLHTCIKGEA